MGHVGDMSETFWGQSQDSEDEVTVVDANHDLVTMTSKEYFDDRSCGSQPMSKFKHFLRKSLKDPNVVTCTSSGSVRESLKDPSVVLTSTSSGSGGGIEETARLGREYLVHHSVIEEEEEPEEEPIEKEKQCPPVLRRGVSSECIDPEKPAKRLRVE